MLWYNCSWFQFFIYFFCLFCPTLNQECRKRFFLVFLLVFHREAPGQWQSILCQPQHTDNAMGRSSDPRVRPRLKCILTCMSVHEFDCCFGCYIGSLWCWQEHYSLDQKVTALIWKFTLRKVTSVSATFRPLIHKLCTFRHKFRKILGLYII